jgi:spore coat protein U-like protein
MTIPHALRYSAAALLSLHALEARALINCNAVASAVSAVYFENDTNPTNGSWNVAINCTRGAGDPNTSDYTLRADNGLNVNGGSNQAVNGTGATNRMAYDLFRTAPGSGPWGNNNNSDFSGTVSFGSSLSASASHTFYTSIPAGQNKTAKIFTDTVTMRLRYESGSGNVNVSPTFPVSINNLSVCLLSTPPANIAFYYTSFQLPAATASAAYAVRCTTGESYNMALDISTGTGLNLPYNLTVNTATQVGTGFPQNFTINGTIAGGLSGTCASATCASPPQQHTLIITY